jgi:hypothetical protein
MTQERESKREGGGGGSNLNTYTFTRKKELQSCMVVWYGNFPRSQFCNFRLHNKKISESTE